MVVKYVWCLTPIVNTVHCHLCIISNLDKIEALLSFRQKKDFTNVWNEWLNVKLF